MLTPGASLDEPIEYTNGFDGRAHDSANRFPEGVILP